MQPSDKTSKFNRTVLLCLHQAQCPPCTSPSNTRWGSWQWTAASTCVWSHSWRTQWLSTWICQTRWSSGLTCLWRKSTGKNLYLCPFFFTFLYEFLASFCIVWSGSHSRPMMQMKLIFPLLPSSKQLYDRCGWQFLSPQCGGWKWDRGPRGHCGGLDPWQHLLDWQSFEDYFCSNNGWQ